MSVEQIEAWFLILKFLCSGALHFVWSKQSGSQFRLQNSIWLILVNEPNGVLGVERNWKAWWDRCPYGMQQLRFVMECARNNSGGFLLCIAQAAILFVLITCSGPHPDGIWRQQPLVSHRRYRWRCQSLGHLRLLSPRHRRNHHKTTEYVHVMLALYWGTKRRSFSCDDFFSVTFISMYYDKFLLFGLLKEVETN